MFVKPTTGLVLDPDTRRPLPNEGAEVRETPYWMRRLARGDVKLATPITEAPTTEESDP